MNDLPTLVLLLLVHFAVATGLLFLGGGVLEMMRRLRRMLEGDGIGALNAIRGRTHGQRRLGSVVQVGRVQATGLRDGREGPILVGTRGTSRDSVAFTGVEDLVVLGFFRQKDRLAVWSEGNVSENVIQVQRCGISTRRDGGRRLRRQARREEGGRDSGHDDDG